MQPVVQPAVQPVVQPEKCLCTRYSRLYNRLYSRLYNRLHRVYAALVVVLGLLSCGKTKSHSQDIHIDSNHDAMNRDLYNHGIPKTAAS